MDLVLEGLPWEICLGYLDDVIMFYPIWESSGPPLASFPASMRGQVEAETL